MPLDYSKLQQFNYGLSYKEQEELKKSYIINEINARIEKTNMKQAEIDNLLFEKGLIIGDIINIIKQDMSNSSNNLFSWANLPELFSNAISLPKEKPVEELTEQEKKYSSARDMIIFTIRQELLSNDENFIFNDIIVYGFGEAYIVEFIYKEQIVHVCVPIFQSANEKNYLTLLAGYQVLYQEGEYSWKTVSFGFNFQKISTDIKMWTEKVNKEKEEKNGTKEQKQ